MRRRWSNRCPPRGPRDPGDGLDDGAGGERRGEFRRGRAGCGWQVAHPGSSGEARRPHNGECFFRRRIQKIPVQDPTPSILGLVCYG